MTVNPLHIDFDIDQIFAPPSQIMLINDRPVVYKPTQPLLVPISKKRKRDFGRWKCKEHFQYMEIAEQYGDNIRLMFKKVEEKLPGRNPVQIRAHHQKMMAKYGSISNMIASYPSKTDAHRMIKMVEQLNKHEDFLMAISSKIKSLYQ